MNDPRITAYALGELTGKERDNFERELADSDALQSELNNVVWMANDLGRLPKPSEGLTTEDRIALLRACHENQAEFQRNKKILRWFIPFGLAAAASVAFLASILYRPSAAELAMTRQSETPAALVEDALQEPALAATQEMNMAADLKSHLEPNTEVLAHHSAPSGDAAKPSIKSKSNGCETDHDLPEQNMNTEEHISVSGLAFNPEKPGTTIPLKENQKVIRNATFGGRLVDTKNQRTSFYSLDVDPSGYARIRKEILGGKLPAPDSVHIEELINAFTYNYAAPAGNAAFSANIESGKAPWNEEHLLVRVGIRANANADNVKVEALFNPARVAYFRLIGYENQKDSEKGVIVSTKVVTPFDHTALYEVIPVGKSQPKTAPKDFQRTRAVVEYQPVDTGDLLTLKIHQRPPGATHCQLAVFRVESSTPESFEKNSVDFRFVAAVAAFGMKLRHSPDAANIAWTKIEQIAAGSLGADPDGQRSDFAKLVAKASRLENSGVSMLLSKAPFFALSFLP
jgi:hypothetical protein